LGRKILGRKKENPKNLIFSSSLQEESPPPSFRIFGLLPLHLEPPLSTKRAPHYSLLEATRFERLK
jgi:hypothetical protein